MASGWAWNLEFRRIEGMKNQDGKHLALKGMLHTCQEHAPAYYRNEEDAGFRDKFERPVDVEQRKNVLQSIADS